MYDSKKENREDRTSDIIRMVTSQNNGIDSGAGEVKDDDFHKTQQIIRKLTSNMNEFFWSAARIPDGREDVFYTESIFKITGYTPEEMKSFPGRGFHIMHPEDSLQIKKKISAFENDPLQTSITLSYRILNKKNKYIWIRETISVERDHLGKITRYYGIVVDITDQKNAEDAVLQSEQSLREINSAKDKFISIVSHDLRAPFTSIMGFAEILLNEPNLPETEKQEYLTYIYESSQSQLHLINYLLDWSRLQSGKMKIEPERLRVSNIVYNSISSLTGNAIRKNIEIRADIPDDIIILADERLITQAVTNLISNAIKFSRSDSTVEINATIYKKGFVEIIVKDEGIGISEANKAKIFKFEQKFSSNGTKGEKGSGLGLTLVKEIIEKLGGDIWFYSEEDRGSEFHITVPEASNIALIVEDDPSSGMMLHKAVAKRMPNFEIMHAANGFEAISIILNKIPAFVVTDHEMPLMNGLQLIESMRKKDESNKIPVVVIAAMLTDDLKGKYAKLGVENIFTKPIDLHVFNECLKNIVN